jgi:very-short-patch-repair endonuclease
MKLKNKEDFIIDVRRIHGNKYDYSLVDYKNNKTKVNIICNECKNVFYQRPDSHTVNKQGCNFCYGNIKLTNEEFIKRSNEIHENKYCYEKCIYIRAMDKVIITCPTHGDFLMKPSAHINAKNGCFKCSHIVKVDNESFIEKATKIYDGLYDYSLVNVIGNNKSRVNIICKEHDVFSKIINAHLRGQGCPKCYSNKSESYMEKQLKEKKINYTVQKTFEKCIRKRKLMFDFYLDDFNTCIEIDGVQHFKPSPKFGGEKQLIIQQEIDSIKNKFCLDNDIPLFRIKYTHLSNPFKKEVEDLLEKIISINHGSTN